jgi:hypothetical protein
MLDALNKKWERLHANIFFHQARTFFTISYYIRDVVDLSTMDGLESFSSALTSHKKMMLSGNYI